MSVLSLWRRACIACAWLAVAHSAAVADEIVVECGDLTFASGYASTYDRLTIRPTWTVYIGCMTSSSGKAIDLTPGNLVTIPTEVAGLRKGVFPTNVGGSQQFGVALGISLTSTFQNFDVVKPASAGLVVTATGGVLDLQEFTIRFRGRAKTEAGAPNRREFLPGIVASLKEGGLAVGKVRLPNGEVEPEPLPEDTANVVTNFPPYYVGDDGRVYPVEPPNYTIGTESGNWGTGTRWRDVSSPGGAGSGAPSWLTDSLPGAGTFTDSSGSVWHVGSLGVDMSDWTGTVTRGPDGSTHISMNGEGYGETLGFTFPPGYKPEKLDGVPAAAEPDFSNVDPCFNAAKADMGLEDGGGGDPPPDPDPPEDLPEGVIGDPPPVGPSTLPGSTGGGGTGGPGSVAGPSVPLPTPPAPGGGVAPIGPLPPDYVPGAPLPEDAAANAWASDTAKEMAAKAGEVQTTAEGFMGWATVQPGGFGSLGEWTIALPIAGHTFQMEIPTGHAALVRALLLLLVKAAFVVGVFRLLIS